MNSDVNAYFLNRNGLQSNNVNVIFEDDIFIDFLIIFLSGIYSDYFTTAVRTDMNTKPGDARGISFLLIPRTKGVITRKMHTGGGWCSGTTLISFNDVKVPIENLIGVENRVRISLAFLDII